MEVSMGVCGLRGKKTALNFGVKSISEREVKRILMGDRYVVHVCLTCHMPSERAFNVVMN